jgi:hypothetical protein
MTKHSKTKSLRKFLIRNGWQTEDNVIWQRGDLKIALAMPTGWVLAKRDFNAPRDYSTVASGIGIVELERYLKAQKLISARKRTKKANYQTI